MEGMWDVVTAKFSFKAANNDELDLSIGSVVVVTQRVSGGWWEGTRASDGSTGWFPSNHVEESDVKCLPDIIRDIPEEVLTNIIDCRQQIIEDLIEKEKEFVSDLRNLLSQYLLPLHHSKILAPAEYMRLVGNLEVLVSAHSRLNSTLVDMVTTQTPKLMRLGQAFLQHGSGILCAHLEYWSNHPKAVCILEQHHKTMNSWLERLHPEHTYPPGLMLLTAGLARPFRHLERMAGVLQEVAWHTLDHHPDRGDTLRSIFFYKDVAERAAEVRKYTELELEVLTGPVRGWRGMPGIQELGELLKMGGVMLRQVGQQEIDIHLVLFQANLVMLRASDSLAVFNFKGRLPLAGLTVRKDDIEQLTFEISGPRLANLSCVCPSPRECEEWYMKLRSQILTSRGADPVQVHPRLYNSECPPYELLTAWIRDLMEQKKLTFQHIKSMRKVGQAVSSTSPCLQRAEHPIRPDLDVLDDKDERHSLLEPKKTLVKLKEPSIGPNPSFIRYISQHAEDNSEGAQNTVDDKDCITLVSPTSETPGEDEIVEYNAEEMTFLLPRSLLSSSLESVSVNNTPGSTSARACLSSLGVSAETDDSSIIGTRHSCDTAPWGRRLPGQALQGDSGEVGTGLRVASEGRYFQQQRTGKPWLMSHSASVLQDGPIWHHNQVIENDHIVMSKAISTNKTLEQGNQDYRREDIDAIQGRLTEGGLRNTRDLTYVSTQSPLIPLRENNGCSPSINHYDYIDTFPNHIYYPNEIRERHQSANAIHQPTNHKLQNCNGQSQHHSCIQIGKCPCIQHRHQNHKSSLNHPHHLYRSDKNVHQHHNQPTTPRQRRAKNKSKTVHRQNEASTRERNSESPPSWISCFPSPKSRRKSESSIPQDTYIRKIGNKASVTPLSPHTSSNPSRKKGNNTSLVSLTTPTSPESVSKGVIQASTTSLTTPISPTATRKQYFESSMSSPSTSFSPTVKRKGDIKSSKTSLGTPASPTPTRKRMDLVKESPIKNIDKTPSGDIQSSYFSLATPASPTPTRKRMDHVKESPIKYIDKTPSVDIQSSNSSLGTPASPNPTRKRMDHVKESPIKYIDKTPSENSLILPYCPPLMVDYEDFSNSRLFQLQTPDNSKRRVDSPRFERRAHSKIRSKSSSTRSSQLAVIPITSSPAENTPPQETPRRQYSSQLVAQVIPIRTASYVSHPPTVNSNIMISVPPQSITIQERTLDPLQNQEQYTSRYSSPLLPRCTCDSSRRSSDSGLADMGRRHTDGCPLYSPGIHPQSGGGSGTIYHGPSRYPSISHCSCGAPILPAPEQPRLTQELATVTFPQNQLMQARSRECLPQAVHSLSLSDLSSAHGAIPPSDQALSCEDIPGGMMPSANQWTRTKETYKTGLYAHWWLSASLQPIKEEQQSDQMSTKL